MTKLKWLLLLGVVAVIVAMTLACGGSSLSTPAPACNSETFRGSGDNVINVGHVGGCSQVTLKHEGTSNFIVVPYDKNNTRRSSLCNEIGVYEGTVKWDAKADTLEIKAGGAWTISVKP